MKEAVTINMELTIPSQKILHHLMLHNETIENEVQKGIQKAIDELSKDNYIADKVSEKVKDAVIHSISNNYQIKNDLTTMIKNKINIHLDAMIDNQLAKRVESLKNDI